MFQMLNMHDKSVFLEESAFSAISLAKDPSEAFECGKVLIIICRIHQWNSAEAKTKEYAKTVVGIVLAHHKHCSL